MIRQITYQPKDSEEMKTKWIFRDDGDLSKDYSDFKTMEVMLNDLRMLFGAWMIASPKKEEGGDE